MRPDMLETNSDFEYEALDLAHQKCMRLIRLRPNKFAKSGQSKIRMQLETIQARDIDTLRYRALSYTWGPEHPQHEIEVNDGKFLIRQNLHEFLTMYTQHISEERLIWIDQICINQSDNIEKAHTVGAMDKIYREAEEVIVWLGTATRSSPRLFRDLPLVQAKNLELAAYSGPQNWSIPIMEVLQYQYSEEDI